jgi:phospholipid N-methyltransferase
VQVLFNKISTMFADLLLFFSAWIRNPLRVAAVAPSSRSLAAVMTAEISLARAPVIELGPGSGIFTRALLARGVPEDQLTLIESGSEFGTLLKKRFPAARIFCMDATHLRRSALLGEERAGAVVSGLPLLSMSPRKIMTILKGAFLHLREDGAFYQFTYGATCPVPQRLLDRMGLEATRIGGTFANLPPAAVYRIRRRAIRLQSEVSSVAEMPSFVPLGDAISSPVV